MPYKLNDQVLSADFVIGDVRYPANVLTLWPREDLEAIGLEWFAPAPPSVQALCLDVDRERDRRLALDFVYDFGSTPAANDAGDVIEAGERALQMAPANRADWQTVHGLALAAVVAGSPSAVIPLRAEDNWNIQTPAIQVLACLAAAALRGSAIVFHGGALKSAIRAAEDPSSVDITIGWPG